MSEVSKELTARINLLQRSDTLTDIINQAYLLNAPYEVIEPFVKQIDELTIKYNQEPLSIIQ